VARTPKVTELFDDLPTLAETIAGWQHEDGWHGPGSLAPTARSRQVALLVAAIVDVPRPPHHVAVGPHPIGGVVFEASTATAHLAARIAPDGAKVTLRVDPCTGPGTRRAERWDGDLDVEALAQFLLDGRLPHIGDP